MNFLWQSEEWRAFFNSSLNKSLEGLRYEVQTRSRGSLMPFFEKYRIVFKRTILKQVICEGGKTLKRSVNQKRSKNEKIESDFER